jgi:hypothetical protein
MDHGLAVLRLRAVQERGHPGARVFERVEAPLEARGLGGGDLRGEAGIRLAREEGHRGEEDAHGPAP